MDTRYWGPSGWRLLHLIATAAAAAGGKPNRDVCAFFEVLPYVLPCKYCRHSLSGYLQADPVDCAAREGRLARWLWRIHNDVNAKLRGQGLRVAADPPFAAVQRIYKDRLAAGCSRTHFDGWEFLFSVAEAHPLSRAAAVSVPIRGHPPLKELAGAEPLERNRWNVMTPEERLPYYNRFWKLLPEVLPFPEWRSAWKAAAARTPPQCRTECLRHLWGVRRAMEEELALLNRTTYSDLCRELRVHRSGCGASSRGKTCRRKRETTRRRHG